ncbi:MAG: L,D-transpeptidase [Polyangiaceae bacterium]|nr:L,D-transpeptidase [Polyangiaceae bacterium]
MRLAPPGRSGRSALGRWLLVALSSAAGLASGCQRGAPSDGAASASASASVSGAVADAPPPAATFGKNSVAAVMPSGKPLLGITSFAAIVYAEPRDTSKRLGYLRLGAKVPRSEEPAGTKGCAGGWYEISPKGFVCSGKDATTNLEDPILLASARRPDLTAALPYRYGFVRAVLPLYLRVPTADEQYKSEFKLKDHLEWYEANKQEVDKVKLGAWDVPLDERGVPIRGKGLGELGQKKTSLEVSLGEHFGGASDNDPIPFFLEGNKRSIPNVSDFAVPDSSVFADRARRFSGLAFVGSFKGGEDALNRRFAITTDLRLAPTTKVKPDTGSPWHGIEIEDVSQLPFAFVREQGAVRFVASGENASRGDELPFRSVVKLTGKIKRVGGEKYYPMAEGDLVRASDVGLVVAPRTFPKAAEDGEKWIEVNIAEQTLVMWEGKRPIYATLVSTGREEYPTVTGEFRIRNKHITATMDSDESSSVGGGAPKRAANRGSGGGSSEKAASDKPAASKPADKKKAGDKKKTPAKGGDKGSKSAPAKAAPAKPGAPIPKKGDGEYGVTKRRGEGTYQLRDVPYIQYFANGYALHAAYWHDVFGKQKSHGCVNLSPIDAHRVFMWTEPAVPEGWHSINSGEEFGEGTVVIVHE